MDKPNKKHIHPLATDKLRNRDKTTQKKMRKPRKVPNEEVYGDIKPLYCLPLVREKRSSYKGLFRDVAVGEVLWTV